MWKPVSKPTAGSGGERPPHVDPGPLASGCPALAWYLCASCWPDGTAKNPGKIEVNVWQNRFQGTLRVPGLGLMLRVEIPDAESVFLALDACLRLETVPWIPDLWSGSQTTDKAKKKTS